MNISKNLSDYSKPLTDLKNEKYFSKSTGGIPNHEDVAGTSKNIEEFGLKSGKDLTILCCQSDTILLADA